MLLSSQQSMDTPAQGETQSLHMPSEALSVEGIDAFYGTSQVLFGLSFTLCAGHTMALLGRNGAGKSTTLKSIAGIVRGRKGTVRLDGRSIRRLAPYKIARAGVAFVPEERQIFPELTVEDNLLIAAKRGVSGKIDWPLDRILEMLPLLEPLRTRLGGKLSGGEQQMLTIARALMGNPSVILLDEPSEGLAPIIVQQIGDLIRTLREASVTILLAEQNLQFCLGLADDALVIDKGNNVFYGSIEELKTRADIKRRYLSV